MLAGGTQTQDQKNTVNTLDSLVGMLNTAADGRYLFSGSTVDQEPVVSADNILNGDGLKAGLKQVIDERKQADLGASGLGRLAVGASGSTGGFADGGRVAVRLQARRRHHGDGRRDGQRAEPVRRRRCRSISARANPSRTATPSSSPSRCRTAPAAT